MGNEVIIVFGLISVVILFVIFLRQLGVFQGGGTMKKRLSYFEARDRMDDLIIDMETGGAYPFAHLVDMDKGGEVYKGLYFSTGDGLHGHDETFLRVVRGRNVISLECWDPNSIARNIHYIRPDDPMVDPIHSAMARRMAQAEEEKAHLVRINHELTQENGLLSVRFKELAYKRELFDGKVEKPPVIISRAEKERIESKKPPSTEEVNL